MSSSFLEKNQDFVLKLKIKGADGQTQIRRVRLPRIADASGSISYDELVGLVVVFTFPEASASGSSGYNVSLTYYDVDGDSITIASSEELLDACEQYVGQKVLRITTFVKPVASVPLSAAAAPAAKAGDKKQPPSVDRGTSTTASSPPPIHMQDVLESFVGVLATAVHHLQEGLAAPSSKNPRPSVASAARAKPNGSESDETKADEAAAEQTEETEDTKPSAENSTKSASESGSEEEEEAEQPLRAFIHGRHTCDSCLSTPIFGTRYHATNLPDYDLCENCFKNYMGTEIVLEPSELDRDRAAQDRWHRRWEASERCRKASQMAQSKGHRGRFGKSIGPRVRRGLVGVRTARAGRIACGPPGPPPHHVAAPPPPPPQGHCPPPPPPPGHCPPPFGPPPHMGPGGFHHHHHWAHIGPHVAPHMQPPASGLASEFDIALKEAIRRSLSDIAPKEVELAKSMESSPKPSAPVEEFAEAKIAAADTEPRKECSAIDTSSVEEKESVDPDTDDAEAQTDEVNDIPRSVEIVKTEEDFALETEAMEKSMDDTESVDSETLAAESENAPTSPSSVPSKASTSSHKVSDVSKEESFAWDAKGNGDVAEAMGAALDAVVDVIREMQADGQSVANDDVGTESGELIVHQETESKDDESEWSVVKSVGSNGTTQSEQIAKAAELLGSALYNSDMKNSSEGEGNGPGSVAGSSFSIPSSVPTDFGTHHAAPAQIDRWGAYLLQLRELGFDNEDECVEVLERLEAANIGVDEDGDVSINRVINELLEKQK